MREITIAIAIVAAMSWAVSTDGANAVRARSRRPAESSARQYLRQYQR